MHFYIYFCLTKLDTFVIKFHTEDVQLLWDRSSTLQFYSCFCPIKLDTCVIEFHKLNVQLLFYNCFCPGNQTCRTLLEKQGWTHKRCTLMDPPHMAVQKQDDQHEHTFSSYVRIRDVVLKSYLGQWTIERSGERGSGISVLPARHDDDDIVLQFLIKFLPFSKDCLEWKKIKLTAIECS